MPMQSSIPAVKNSGQKREILEAEYRKIESGASQEYRKFESKILEVLTRFLISGVYGAEKRFELSSSINGVIRGDGRFGFRPAVPL